MAFTRLDAQALGTVFECVFYGAYVVLFILYLVLQHRHNRGFGEPLTLAQILLFSFCTISFCLDIPAAYLIVVPSAKNSNISDKLNLGSITMFATVDYLAQMILLYRCWIIWGRRWIVVAVPGFLALVSLGGGLALAGLDNSPLWSTDQEKILRIFKLTGITAYSISLSVNAITTSLIVTKIILTSRKVRPVLGLNSRRALRITTAMTIESGLLMFALQLIVVALFAREAFAVISSPIVQIFGIVPTLLGIRVVMGSVCVKPAEGAHCMGSVHSGGAAIHSTGPFMSAAGLQSWGTNTEFNGDSHSERAIGTAI
ncbi:hypothetical protein BD779DRAFT_1675414 [Infundibulicybe gibba]|nr:hypothetical protein BD779DRAFT_1675414 [Infundibulicybe gibba]